MGGVSPLSLVVMWMAAAYTAVAVILIVAVAVLHSVADWFRDKGWRRTEDPWRVYQIDHYGKIIED